MFITFLVMHKYLFPALNLSYSLGTLPPWDSKQMADTQTQTARTQYHASVRKLLIHTVPIHTVTHMTGVHLSHGKVSATNYLTIEVKDKCQLLWEQTLHRISDSTSCYSRLQLVSTPLAKTYQVHKLTPCFEQI